MPALPSHLQTPAHSLFSLPQTQALRRCAHLRASAPIPRQKSRRVPQPMSARAPVRQVERGGVSTHVADALPRAAGDLPLRDWHACASTASGGLLHAHHRCSQQKGTRSLLPLADHRRASSRPGIRVGPGHPCPPPAQPKPSYSHGMLAAPLRRDLGCCPNRRGYFCCCKPPPPSTRAWNLQGGDSPTASINSVSAELVLFPVQWALAKDSVPATAPPSSALAVRLPQQVFPLSWLPDAEMPSTARVKVRMTSTAMGGHGSL